MKLTTFFKNNPKVALAFSGGVDSAYLLYAASQAGAQVTAYYVNTAFQPAFELEDARRLALELNMPMKIITCDILSEHKVTENPKNRCYYCKRRLFEAILREAKKDGYPMVIDGSNASDDAGDRPGMKALGELSVRSPLRECGLTKAMIRQYSKEAGLFTWNKPAYACLATRIPTGESITSEKLQRTEMAENYLHSLGYVDFRVRMRGNTARLEMKKEQFPQLFQELDTIKEELLHYYDDITVDQEGR